VYTCSTSVDVFERWWSERVGRGDEEPIRRGHISLGRAVTCLLGNFQSFSLLVPYFVAALNLLID